ncbi:MAG: thermonuclease family protein [Parvibaculaceae bacterium]
MTKLRMIALVGMMALGPAGTGAAAAETVSGPADVRDEVTVAIGGARYRLQGVEVGGDARCGASVCGDAAAEALRQWIGAEPLSCDKLSRLGHGFFLARCRTASGEDLGRKLLEEGIARPGEGADAAYIEASDGAKAAHRGQWAQ